MPIPLVSEIATARLDLIPISPAAILSEQAADGRLAQLIRCKIPLTWPPETWEPHVFPFLLAQYNRAPEQASWNRYIALRNPDGNRALIGTLGAFQSETTPTEAEMGYAILPPYQRKGFATEAAQALIALLRDDPRLQFVVAHTYPHLTASIRVMEKCGLLFDSPGQEEGTVRYLLALRPPP